VASSIATLRHALGKRDPAAPATAALDALILDIARSQVRGSAEHDSFGDIGTALESFTEEHQCFPGAWRRKLQTHRLYGL
jgi:hypothetical protein